MSIHEDNSGQEDMVSGTPLLDRIKRPADVKQFTREELHEVAAEIRRRIIETASENGGHLAPHLGVVELATAIHYAFDTEQEPVVWDVGHQCYAHKLLTGRADRFHTVRKKGGLSGYPKITESPYDAFGVGHSSTSISAALGMAVANTFEGSNKRVIAVIGDGAITGGMAFEALAHAGHLGSNLLVILNDNKMSISPNVGALSSYFSRLITGGLYTKAREDISAVMKQFLGPQLTKAAHKVESSVKGLMTPTTIFQELGLKYVGPIDGHDLDTLVDFFNNLKHIQGPIFFHCVTRKGKGYEYAEEDPLTYHGVKAFDVRTGKFKVGSQASPVPSFTDAFADTLVDAAAQDSRICGITAAMPTGTGLNRLEQRFPGRFFDVGICEQHAVTFAGGLAIKGMRPVCAIYSTFLQRGYDQYIHDVCLQNLPVVFAIDRAGAVGEDSPTQQGAFDLSFLRVIPNVTILAPRDAMDTELALRWALQHDGPVAIRYARSKAPNLGDPSRPDITKAQRVRDGKDATILGLGPCLANALEAAGQLEDEGWSIGVVDARVVKPLDAEMLASLAGTPILTMEENTVQGGFGAAVMEHLLNAGHLADTPFKAIGFPDAFIEHATREEQIEEIGLDTKGIKASVKSLLEATAPRAV